MPRKTLVTETPLRPATGWFRNPAQNSTKSRKRSNRTVNETKIMATYGFLIYYSARAG
jgi:hypothetical protein